METSSDIGLDLADDDTPTRHSSKLSLGSSPSVLSGDEEDHDIDDDDGLLRDDHRPDASDQTGFLNNNHANDGDDKHAFSGTNKIVEENPHDATTTLANVEEADIAPHHDTDDHNEVDDDLDDLFNGPLLPSTGDLDDLTIDQDSASPLSSVPDDFPLSRSVSPGSQEGDHDDPLMLLSPLPLQQQQQQQEQSEQHTSSSPPASQEQPSLLNGSRKRKGILGQSSGNDGNDTHGGPPALSEHDADTTLSNKSRRLSMAGRVLYGRLANETENVHTEEDDTLVDDGDNDGKEEDNQDGRDDREQQQHHTSNHSSSSPVIEQQQQHSNGDKVESPLPPPPPPPPDMATTLTGPSWDDAAVEDRPSASSSSTHDEDQDSQQRHKEALETLTHIEIEFARLRDKMYQEKMAELNEEAIKIANGTHSELVTLMTEIEEKKHRRIRTAEAWRKYQHGNFQRQFEGAEYQANVQFISKKAALRRDLLSTTNGKRWRLEDEQNKLNDPLQKPEKLIPDALTLRMQKQTKRDEAMELQDIKDAIGFPRAPQVPGSSQQDIKDDLLLLGLGPSGGSR